MDEAFNGVVVWLRFSFAANRSPNLVTYVLHIVSESAGAEDPPHHPVHSPIFSQNLVVSVHTYKANNKLFTVSEGTAQPVAM